MYQQITGINARGQIESEVHGNGVLQSQVYDAAMGWLDNATVSKSGVTQQSYDNSIDRWAMLPAATYRVNHKPLAVTQGAESAISCALA
jgi:hypothetical protein